MNRNIYRLVQNIFGQWVAVPEYARGQHKGSGLAKRAASILFPAAVIGWSSAAMAAGSLPTACGTCSGATGFAAPGSVADYRISGNTGTISQVGNSAIVNFKDYNVGSGNAVIYQQVKDLNTHDLVNAATFTNLTQIWDNNPSVIAGQIHAAAGQNVNLMMLNTNGIIFANGAQVDVNTLFAGSLGFNQKYLNNIAPVNNVDVSGNPIPQFEGNSGFVKVLEGARITASKGGSVVLFAPTVTNRGTIETSGGGQSVLAAGDKVYLIANEKKSDGSAVDSNFTGFLVEVDNTNLAGGQYDKSNTSIPNTVNLDGNTISVGDQYDKLGNATNIGSITSQHGNITMVGLAVNQMGRLTATSTLSQNGSIYLYAKDTVKNANSVTDTSADIYFADKRSGRLTVGSGSVTQVLPDLTDSGTMIQSQIDSGGALPGIVRLVGKNINVQSNARVIANSGKINVYAINDPSSLSIFNSTSTSDPFSKAAFGQEDTSIYIGQNALFDVSGLSYQKSVADNYYLFTLRSDELKDSPVNRNDLRLTKVWVDLLKGSPLISNAADYKSNMKVSIGENSTSAGSISLNSTGQTVVDKSAQFNLSGGKVVYTDAYQDTTLLFGADNKWYKPENASADTKYVSVGVTVDNTGKATTLYANTQRGLVKGYTVGKDAGSLSINSPQAYFAGNVLGNTTLGENQALAGTPPAGASLTFNNLVYDAQHQSMSGLLQDVVIGNAPAALDANYKAGDKLSGDLANTLHLDASILGSGQVNKLSVNSVKSVNVDRAVQLDPKGTISLSGHDVAVNANIISKGGSISLNAKDNPQLSSDVATLKIANQVVLDAAGGWFNSQLEPNVTQTAKVINGGSVSLSAGNGIVQLGQNSLIDVRGGAYLGAGNVLKAGNGGNASINAWEVAVDDLLQAHLRGEAIGTGGTLSVGAANVKISNVAQSNSLTVTSADPSKSVLWLGSNFFQQGFSAYKISGAAGLEVADGTTVNVTTNQLQLNPIAATFASGTNMDAVTRAKPALLQYTTPPASISLASSSLINQANTEVFGSTTIGNGASVNVDAGGAINLASVKDIEVNGKLTAKAGSISLTQSGSDSITGTQRVYLGSQSVLDASGFAKVYKNSQNLMLGSVLDGGVVNISANGYVATEAGSLIDVHGNSPVRVDIFNSDGSFGALVGSNGGSVSITVGSGAYLNGNLNGAAGGQGLSGGAFNLGFTTSAAAGKTIHVGQYGSPIASGGLPSASLTNQVYADLPKIVDAGFDNIKLSSSDTIRFEGDFSAGMSRAPQSVQLLASNFSSDGGFAQIGANIVKMSRLADSQSVVPSAPVVGTGNLLVKANLIELAGKTSFSGFTTHDAQGAGLTLDSKGEFRLSSVNNFSTSVYQQGFLNTKADIDIRAAVVSPSSLADYSISTSGDVLFSSNGAVTNPISALGKLTVNANNITQNGSIVAPFGVISLNAANNLTLGSNSLTSVAANAGAVLPLGKTSNGDTYYIDSNGNSQAISQNTLSTLPSKVVSLNGKTVDMQSGSKVDISGGGDTQAWEFTAGTGGSTDILANSGYYALLPDYAGIAATTDFQESVGSLSLGKRVYLAGGNGIKAGYYTLMPAHYGLLPGAYTIKVSSGVADLLPKETYVKQDGTAVVAGFLTDSRNGSLNPVNGRWTGFEVLTRDQVMTHSGYTLTSASDFFTDIAGSASPADAGLLQIQSQKSINLAGELVTAALAGGKGAAVDISATKLAILDGTSANADEVGLDVTALNNLKADSLLLGGLRTANSDGTTSLSLSADTVRMNTLDTHPLTAKEVMLAATSNISLQNGSAIVADGDGGSVRTLNVNGNHALVRVATSEANVVSTGVVDSSKGTITTDATTHLSASNSITLDATKDAKVAGQLSFVKDGKKVDGNLSVASSNINLGNAIPNTAIGLSLDQSKLDELGALSALNLRSYSSFNVYGNANLGSVDGQGVYQLGRLTLDGAGLAGHTANANVTINADQLTLKNTNSTDANLIPNATGTGQLNVNTHQLVMAGGNRQIAGFSQTNVTANEIYGDGTGTTNVSGDLNIATNRFTGAAAAIQTIKTTGGFNANRLSNESLYVNNAMGSDWNLVGASLNLNTLIESHGGNANLLATAGNVTLGSAASIDVSGRSNTFFDVTSAAPAGNVTISANQGDVIASNGSLINVSSAKGGNAGSLTIQASNGKADIASATIYGTNLTNASGVAGTGAAFTIDANQITNFDQLNQNLNQGGFTESRSYRLRSGDLTVTQSGTGAINAHNIEIDTDGGNLNVSNEMNADGKNGGNINLNAGKDITIGTGAYLHANANTDGGMGGKVRVATTGGSLSLAAGIISVADRKGGDSGQVTLSAPRTDTSLAVSSINTSIQGAKSVVLEGLKTYNNINHLTANTTSGDSLGVDQILSDNDTFMANQASILATLGTVAQKSNFHLRGSAEVQSNGNMTVDDDVDFYQPNRSGNEPGILTLRAAKDLAINGSISDGFDGNGRLASNDSWSYNLVAGSDLSAANVLATNDIASGNFALSQGKTIRTGTGQIEIAVAGNFDLGKSSSGANQQTSTIYTAGKASAYPDGYYGLNSPFDGAVPTDVGTGLETSPQFGTDGGSISMNVKGNVNGAKTNQLYSDWLWRVGQTNNSGAFGFDNDNYKMYLQTAWWVDYNSFQQGIATFGGGNINLNAGGSVQDVSLSTVTNGRLAANTGVASQLVVLGGGDISVNAGGDIKGGNFYVEQGLLNLNAQGKIGSSPVLVNGVSKDYFPVIALGDAQANLFARQNVEIQTVLNPMTISQSKAELDTLGNYQYPPNYEYFPSADDVVSYFSTYGSHSSVNLTSLSKNANINNFIDGSNTSGVATLAQVYQADQQIIDHISFAGSLSMTAYQGDINVKGNPIAFAPQQQGQLSLLAGGDVNLNTLMVMSDQSLDSIQTVLTPSAANVSIDTTGLAHASTPIHQNDNVPVRIYAEGDINQQQSGGSRLVTAKQTRMIAGGDIVNPNIVAQNIQARDVTYIKAGGDITQSSSGGGNQITLNGPGVLEVEAGRNINLGGSYGIVTQGNAVNTALSDEGATIRIATGVQNGVDYQGALQRLVSALKAASDNGVTISDSTLWQARWLLSEDRSDYKTVGGISDAKTLLSEVNKVASMGSSAIEDRVRNMYYLALRETGRDRIDTASPYTGSWARANDTIVLLFPNINETNTDGTSKYYQGDLKLATSQIKTLDGGDIEFMVPGGSVQGGLTQVSTPLLTSLGAAIREPSNLGMVAIGDGSIKGFSQNSITVNQSRILAVGGGDILLYSNKGDIDAGKGKKSAVSIPAPVKRVVNGLVTVTVNPAATGSGIGTIATGNGTPGDVDLYAPNGTINAGDAGIRCNICSFGGESIIGADNVSSLGGIKGGPTDNSAAISSATSSAAGTGSDTTKAAEQLANAAAKQLADNMPTKSPSPSIINVEVMKIGN